MEKTLYKKKEKKKGKRSTYSTNRLHRRKGEREREKQ